jgi:hypothetical protein
VNDPNYAGNNGKFKVLIFSDKKFYTEFEEKIKKASMTKCVFNGVQAVDCCIHMSEVPEVRNEGQPNEYVYKNKVIDAVTFSKKPYDLPAITKEAIDAFPFDDTYYVQSTKEEIIDFYNKYIKISNDDIPDEDEVEVYQAAPSKPAAKAAPVENENVQIPTDDISDDDIDDLTSDPDEKGLEVPDAPAPKAEINPNDIDVDELLKDDI